MLPYKSNIRTAATIRPKGGGGGGGRDGESATYFQSDISFFLRAREQSRTAGPRLVPLAAPSGRREEIGLRGRKRQ